MRRGPRRTAMAALVLVASALPGRAATHLDLGGTPWAPADTVQFDAASAAGQEFRILLSIPDTPPPPDGYGVIYAFDAAWSFGTLRDLVRLREGGMGGAAIGPTVVVGIGWPTPDLVDLERRKTDMLGDAPDGAGREATLDFLEDVLIPRVEGALQVDAGHRMILGHSVGGVFGLQARMRRPHLFSHVAAGSPSIWSDPDALFEGAQRDGAPTLITLGALESAEAAEAAGVAPERVARLVERDMTGRATEMASLIGAELVIFPGESHGSSIPSFLSRAAGFLWADAP